MRLHLAELIFSRKSDLSMVIRLRSLILMISSYISVMGSCLRVLELAVNWLRVFPLPALYS